VNQQLCETNDAGMFVTAWMGVLEISSGHMVFVNAGHNPPLIRQASGTWEYLKQRSGFVLAGMDGTRYQSGELQLNHGGALYLYTDGVTEAANSEEMLYGETRLRDSLNAAACDTSEQLLASIKCDVDAFVGKEPQFDDITMLVLKLAEGRNPDDGIDCGRNR
jgi:sigma-B regulation protein RsbU (phosphoserine phosphatase)